MQYLHLASNFAVRSMVTKYQLIQDVIYSMEGFNANISAHFNVSQLTNGLILYLNMILFLVSATLK